MSLLTEQEIEEMHESHVCYFYRHHFLYDDETGILTRKHGQFAGYKQKSKLESGHIVVYIAGKTKKAHRVIWMMEHGRSPRGQIDHIDGNPENNRLSNLREASLADNTRNRRSPRAKLHMPKGVRRMWNKFYAEIYLNKKRIPLGSYQTEQEAAHAYNKAAVSFYGDFACLNPI